MMHLNLEVILESLNSASTKDGSSISSKKIDTGNITHRVYIGLDEEKRIHFLVGINKSDDVKSMNSIKLHSITCEVRDWSVLNEPAESFIDIRYLADSNGPTRKLFLSFCEDIVRNLGTNSGSESEIIYRVFKRWKKFWSGKDVSEPTSQWIKGLLGELKFLEMLIENFGLNSIETWIGSDNGPKDFFAGQIAFEVKSSESQPVSMKVNGLGQLDSSKFEFLIVTLFRLKECQDGSCLTEIVHKIERLLSTSDNLLEMFWDKLVVRRYRRDLEELYRMNRYEVAEPIFFHVNENFPVLNESKFSEAIDSRIFDISYNIELVGIDSMPREEVMPVAKKMIDAI